MNSDRVIHWGQAGVLLGLALVAGSMAGVYFLAPAADSILWGVLGFVVPMAGGAMTTLGGFVWRFERNTQRMIKEMTR